jgi:hypothetical protein
MKKVMLFFVLINLVLMNSCFKEEASELKGDQSPMGEVGVTVSSSSMEIAGAKDFQAVITGLKDGTSSYSASAVITNPVLKNLVANFPGVEVNGDVVTITEMKIQQTKEGIKSISGNNAGVLVKYGSKVGDTYPIEGSSGVRTVVSKTGEDDYPYGFMLIKTIQVEQTNFGLKSAGIESVTYIANHKFGMVGVKVDFDDETSVTFPLYSSTEND